jgi:hypothetical protein
MSEKVFEVDPEVELDPQGTAAFGGDLGDFVVGEVALLQVHPVNVLTPSSNPAYCAKMVSQSMLYPLGSLILNFGTRPQRSCGGSASAVRLLRHRFSFFAF